MKTSKNTNPLAQTLRQLITLEQIEQIDDLSDDLEIDRNRAAEDLFKLQTDELSQDGADDVIKYLKNLKG